ncbi:MAG: cytochrome ubiquinol oxidase subunit I [Actinobacteria bacterium]|nr:cytochrome ubiquinol oxidase subunit I [Actinomycetota bacterium]
MDPLIVARWQFGITTVYHFLFVPLTIGLALLVAIQETLYVRTKDVKYLKATKFWGKLFLINFAIGVVTGIVQEFQFGMNWSAYSRFVGDIFGAPLAIEGLAAFFLESTFIGLWIFGWNKLTPKQHMWSAWMVSIGTAVSAFWILAANAFMQYPVGYEVNAATGRAELTSFLDVVTNKVAWVHFIHTIFLAVLTAATLMLATSAWHMLRDRKDAVYRFSAGFASVAIFVASIGVAFSGHWMGQVMTDVQPMKMAAAEALWETEQPAAFSLFAVGDVENGRNHINIAIPRALSLLATNSLDGEVLGINPLQAEFEEEFGPGDYIPPVGTVYWSFRLMIGIGFALMALGAVGTWLLWKQRIADTRWFHRLAVWALALPFLANIFGWAVTEIGRQPWVVYGELLVRDGVSPGVSAGEVLVTLIGFTLLYGLLAVVDVYLMKKYAQEGVTDEATADEVAKALAY